MVTLTAGTGPVNELHDNLYFGPLDDPTATITPTEVRIGDEDFYWNRITGTGFANTDGDGRPDVGTVQTIEVRHGADLVFTISGLALPWADLEAHPSFGFLLRGNDELNLSAEVDEMSGEAGNDLIHGNGGDDILHGDDPFGGNQGDDRLFGDAGNDRLVGGGGDDQLSGGDGDDRLDVTASDSFIVDGGAGNDHWRANFRSDASGLDFSLEAAASDAGLAVGGSVARRVETAELLLGQGGDTFRDRAAGGDDYVDFGGGADTAYVSAGRDELSAGFDSDLDRLFVDYSAATAGLNSDMVTYDAEAFSVYSLWQGPLRHLATLSIISSEFDRVEIVGSGFADRIVGSAGSDRIFAGGGDDVLTPQLGSDLLDGGAGSDTLSFVFSPFVEDFLGTHLPPWLVSGVTIDLALTTAQALPDHNALYGNGIEQRPLGTVTLRSIENAEGTMLADTLRGTAGNNRLVGLAEGDLLDGRGGDDVLDGGDGHDILIGGAGNDSLHGSSGIDTASYATSSGPVTVNLGTTAAQDTGGGGIDRLTAIENAVGTAGADRLTGNSLANRLDGGAGADELRGGAGNDVYVVDQSGDQAIETSSTGGTDQVRSAVAFTLGANLENLVLTGGAAVSGRGNALANILTGNGAANFLNGAAGADVMTGGAGNDGYAVDHAGDQVVEASGGGTDRVSSAISYTLGDHVEHLTLTGLAHVDGTGNALGNTMAGNGARNRLEGGDGGDGIRGGGSIDMLFGGAGDDRLYGGTGSDSLTGGGGKDGFYFDTALGATNVDAIADFSVASDTIFLDRDVFTGLAANGTLAAGAFRAGTAAADADDRILYDAATGEIRYDPDGVGGAAAILFAEVDPGTALTHADFVGYI